MTKLGASGRLAVALNRAGATSARRRSAWPEGVRAAARYTVEQCSRMVRPTWLAVVERYQREAVA